MKYVGMVSGSFSGRRRSSRVQVAVAAHPQMYVTALLALQGRVGLDHPSPGHLHRHLHSLCSSFPSLRAAEYREGRYQLKLFIVFKYILSSYMGNHAI